jgi:hypothetical protein
VIGEEESVLIHILGRIPQILIPVLIVSHVSETIDFQPERVEAEICLDVVP